MSQWTDVAAEAELFEGAGIAVAPGGHDIALYLLGGQVYATDNRCTHGEARLCDGYLDGYEIECPFHQGRFDIRTGHPTAEPCTEPVRTWPVKIEGGRVYVDLSAA
jgi:naphthalene 1,2-dioxygenase system ferredoxin subunit